ncbi:DUF748 domain-containing protein [Desulfogranum mediterraneum]|uniref:DUF748 domain-containing protein n=1 Tax=Desulfogranum mediterraneum TaxID=160661 RepID=UPI00040C326D|nr:DUF748 domain-containing protein [Desulfogranum mediterraneum]
MEHPENEPSVTLPARLWRKPLVRVCAALLVLGAIALLVIPVAGKHYLQKWLLENGADQALVDRVQLNPFTGTVGLRGADIQRGGATVFSNSNLSINLGLGWLLRHQARIEKATIADLMLDIEQHQDGSLRIGSYSLAAGPDSSEELAEVDDSEALNAWIFHAQEVELSNVVVHYTRQGFQSTLVIQEGRSLHLSTNPAAPHGSLMLKGTVNEAPFVLDFSKVALVPQPILEGAVELSTLKLGAFAPLLSPYLSQFHGLAGIAGGLVVTMDREQGPELNFRGSFNLAETDLRGADWQLGGTVDWQGQVGVQLGGEQLRLESDSSLHLNNPAFQLVQETGTLSGGSQAVTWEGRLLYSDKRQAGKEDLARIQGHLVAQAVELDLPGGLSLVQARLESEGSTELHLGQGLAAGYQGRVELEQTRVAAAERLGAEGQLLSWDGAVGYSLDQGKPKISLAGELTGKGLAADLIAAATRLEEESLQLRPDFAITLGDRPAFSGAASAEAASFKLSKGGEPLFTFAGLQLAEVKDDGQGGLRVGALEVKELLLPRSSQLPLEVRLAAATVRNVASPDLASATVEQLALTGAEVWQESGSDQDRVGLGGEAAGAAGGSAPMVTLDALRVNQSRWSSELGLEIDSVVVDTLFARLRKAADSVKGKQEIAESGVRPAGAEPGTEAGPAATAEQPGARALPLAIARIEVVGKSGFRFSDSSLAKPFSTEFLLKKAEALEIDLRQPEQSFGYLLEGAFDTYAPLKIKGRCAPLALPRTLEQETVLRNYSLQQVSPYVMQAVGTYLQSGQLDLRSTLKIRGQDIEMDNNLLFKDIRAKTVDDALAAELNNKLPVPMDIALSILRDNHGNIDLDVPISGQLSDLRVGVVDLLVTAMGTAITVGVTPYLAYTFLGPTGALVYLGAQLGTALLSTDLPVLEFQPGQAELTEQHRQILESVGRTIAQDEETMYSICAKVALADLGRAAGETTTPSQVLGDEASRRQLFLQGESRSLAVKSYLEEHFSIKGEQLLMCNPSFDFEGRGVTTIEFRK